MERRAAVSREMFFDIIAGEGLSDFDLTETVIWMALNINRDGLSIRALSRRTGRDRATIRRRARLMENEGFVVQGVDTWRLTEKGIAVALERFTVIWGLMSDTTQKRIDVVCKSEEI